MRAAASVRSIFSARASASTDDAHTKSMSTFETDEHLPAEHRYTAGVGWSVC